ncbi:MAG: dihydrolipoyl dehydrogenase [Thermoleophilaceae bacterium]|nr:dihydrolipoyl dehydrogenase [Thermoleophilaceae bacterium]
MVVGELAEPVDLLVVGGGPGGYAAALRAAQLGREVTLVERGGPEALGGSCLHVGCIPSKALIELASGVERTRALGAAGLVCPEVSVDLGRFQEWKRGIVAGLAGGVEQLLSRRGVRVVHGSLRFNQPGRAALTTPDGDVRFLEFRQAIVATGSRPVELAALPFDGERVLDSTGALALDAVPASVAVVGAGYIGLELGTALAKLGASVTIVEALDRILPTVDAALAAPVERRLRGLGIELCLGALARELGDRELVLETPDGERRVPAERVVVAVGRRPNTDDLGLPEAGVQVGPDGLIPVGPDRRATERVAAIGDVVAGPALAHKAMREGIVAAEALSGEPAEFDPAAIPAVVFSDPEIATAGLTEAEARAEGLDVQVSTFPWAASGRARTLGERDGFVRLVADRASDRIVGVHAVGPHASELVAEGTLAIEMVASPDDVAGTIHAHPTLSEALGEAAEVLAGRPLHVVT